MFSHTFYCIFQILYYYELKESTTASEKRKKKRQKKKKIPLRGFSLRRYAVYPLRVLLATGYTHNRLLNMQILKDGAIADGGLYVLIYWQFLLQRRLSDSIEQYNEPPRYRSYNKELRKIDFCGSNLPDGCLVRRFSYYKLSWTLLKKWLERNVAWQARYHIRAKVNISMLHWDISNWRALLNYN